MIYMMQELTFYISGCFCQCDHTEYIMRSYFHHERLCVCVYVCVAELQCHARISSSCLGAQIALGWVQ